MKFKAFTITAILSGIMAATSVSAFTINGDSAVALRNSLVGAGATVHFYTEASALSVEKVKCAQESGFVLLPVKCQFIQDGSLIEVNSEGAANSLVDTLRLVGVPVNELRMGELSRTIISARSIQCSTNINFHIFSCVITK